MKIQQISATVCAGLKTLTSDIGAPTLAGWRPEALASLGGLNNATDALSGAPNLAILAGIGALCPEPSGLKAIGLSH